MSGLKIAAAPSARLARSENRGPGARKPGPSITERHRTGQKERTLTAVPPKTAAGSTPKAYAAHDRAQAAFWWLCALDHYAMCFVRLEVLADAALSKAREVIVKI